jgi:DNA repair protein RecO (recombination protein O)
MPLQTTEAIVIGGHNLGEADRIIPFFTRRLGKVRAVAKGARRIRSRFGGTLELFNHGELVFFEWPNRTLHKINEFSVIEPFAPLKADLDRLSRGAYIVELAAGAVEDGESNEEIFLLLRDALGLLVAHDDARLLRTFEIRLLRIAGYLLELYRCLICRVLLDQANGLAISLSKGGLVCVRCQSQVQDKVPISWESLAFLRSVLRGELDMLLATSLPPPHNHDLRELLRVCIVNFLGKTPRSLAFVNRLEQTV